MARYEGRQVRRVGRPVYGRGERMPTRRKPDRISFRQWGRAIRPLLWLIASVGIVLAFLNITKIQTVTIEGASATNFDDINKTVKTGIRKQWFGSSTLLLNSGDLAAHIKKSQPVVEEVNIKRKLPQTIIVAVEERQQGIRWKTGEQIFLLDTKGVIIGEGGVVHEQLPLVKDSTNLPVKQGDRVVSRVFVSFVTKVSAGMPSLGLKSTEMSILETSSELHVVTAKGYVIKFDTSRSAEDALADLKKISDYLQKNKKVPAEYIDLRIPGKAYYR